MHPLPLMPRFLFKKDTLGHTGASRLGEPAESDGSRTRHLVWWLNCSNIPKRAGTGTDTQRRRTWAARAEAGHRYTEEEDRATAAETGQIHRGGGEGANVAGAGGEVYQPGHVTWKLAGGRKDLRGLGGTEPENLDLRLPAPRR